MMFKETITLYNRVADGYNDRYECTILKNVEIQPTNSIKNNNSTDKFKLFININSQNKLYVKPKEYDKSLDKSHCFTVRTGDFFVLGEVTIDNATYQSINKKYDDVYNVTSIKEYSVIPHLEVGGN